MKQLLYLQLTLPLLCYFKSNSQSAPDSVSLTQQRTLFAIYQANTGAASTLYNGPEYFYDDRLLNGHAFLETPTFEKGTLVMDGVTYNDISIAYDILRDELVTLSYEREYKVKIPREKAGSFTLHNRYFIAISGNTIPNGYYEVLYNGQTKLLARREKKVKELINEGRNVVYEVLPVSYYYLLTPSGYERVADKSSFLKRIQNKNKDQVTSFIDSKNLSFSRQLEESLIQSTRYYDQIKNQ